jgi:phosphoglycolate phosphatase
VEKFLDLNAFRGVFDVAFCADDGPGKPHPHMLQLNMSAVGAAPDFTIMIGDTSFDMAMARAAGAYAQGVSWGFHTVDEIAEGGAHHIADSFDALHRELAGWRP